MPKNLQKYLFISLRRKPFFIWMLTQRKEELSTLKNQDKRVEKLSDLRKVI
jgi:hypothetical protein